jgi:hypothetical protein
MLSRAVACAALSCAAVARADAPLEFAPLQAAIAAPPYPVPALSTQVSVDEGKGPELLESFAVTVHAVDALSPAGALPLTVVAVPSADGASFPIELRWSPQAQQALPDEILVDLRVALLPDGGRMPALSDLSVGSVVRGLVLAFDAELAAVQGQLQSVYASHFVEVATGPTLDAALLDPDVVALDDEPPLLRLAFRLVRDGPTPPSPGEPIVVVTAKGEARTVAEVPALPTWLQALVAASLGFVAALTGSRAGCARPRA